MQAANTYYSSAKLYRQIEDSYMLSEGQGHLGFSFSATLTKTYDDTSKYLTDYPHHLSYS